MEHILEGDSAKNLTEDYYKTDKRGKIKYECNFLNKFDILP